MMNIIWSKYVQGAKTLFYSRKPEFAEWDKQKCKSTGQMLKSCTFSLLYLNKNYPHL